MRIEEALFSEAGKSWHKSKYAAGILREIQEKCPGLDLKQKEYRCMTLENGPSSFYMTEKVKLYKELRLHREICILFENRLEWQQLEKGSPHSKPEQEQNSSAVSHLQWSPGPSAWHSREEQKLRHFLKGTAQVSLEHCQAWGIEHLCGKPVQCLATSWQRNAS